MAFKDTWRPRTDKDYNDTTAVNEIAEEVIRQSQEENKIKKDIVDINNNITNNYYNKEEANYLFSNALKGYVSGTIVSMKDVSPIEHEIKVSLLSDNIPPPITEDTKIKVYGGNLFDTFSSIFDPNSTCVRQSDGSYRCNVKYYVYSQFSTHQMNDIMQSLDGQKITFSMSTEMPSDKYMLIIIYYTDGTSCQSKAVLGANSTSIVLNHRGKTIEKVGLRPMAQDEIRFTDTTTIFKDLQVEVGERSPYVPYNPLSLEYNIGDKIKSVYPSMTLISNTKGIDVKAEYNRDINKAFEEVVNAIISLGGNV